VFATAGIRWQYCVFMRIRRLALVAAPVVLALSPAAPPAARADGLLSSEHIITALYAYPGTPGWTQLTGGAPAVSAAIVNMCAADGSGSGCDGTPWTEQPPAAWTTQIDALRGAGITPLVYIATGYGDQGGSPGFSLATVETEVSQAVGWYGTGIGFLLDQAPVACAAESSYYGPLYRYVKSVSRTSTVELNPGTASASMSCYMNASDILGVFEGPETTQPGLPGFQGATFPSWMRSYPASRFAATISAGTLLRLGADIAGALADGIGNVYVDDEAEPPAYDSLPAFWPAEVAAVVACDQLAPRLRRGR
jgi:hypothetical protein